MTQIDLQAKIDHILNSFGYDVVNHPDRSRPELRQKAKAAITALLVEAETAARIDEAKKIYTAYIPIGTPVAHAVRLRIKRNRERIAVLRTKDTKHPGRDG